MLAPRQPNFWISSLLSKKDLASSTLKSTYGPKNSCKTVDWVSKENTRKPTKQFLIKKLSQSEQGSSSSKEFTQLFLPLLSVSRSSLPYLLTCFSLRQASREIKQNWELRQTLIYQKAPRKLALKAELACRRGKSVRAQFFASGSFLKNNE